MPHRGTETDFELTTIERLEELGYGYSHGSDLSRVPTEVVLRDVLRRSLASRYPQLTPASVELAVRAFAMPQGADLLRRNFEFHKALRDGVEILISQDGGQSRFLHVHAIDWDHPDRNDFLVVNQLAVSGRNERRPDIVVYVNGLPLVVFELKNPNDPKPTVGHAHNQIGHYRLDIPQLFEFNALTVISDGVTTLHGMWPADLEWYAPWKSIDGHSVERATTGSMKTLIEGLFPKERLLAYMRDFIAFEDVKGKLTKKGAKYHQFFAAQIAAEKAIASMRPSADRRIGVIWHTTGSGKSLSMAFLVGILRRQPGLNPTFVIQVDRTDLDKQLYDQFVAVRALVGNVARADSVDELRELLASGGGQVVFSTIEKFRLQDGDGVAHPVLSERSDLIVIADEAHRSQYGMTDGFARHLRDALPNARFLGFTGTPISFAGADTTEVFGDLIHVYDIRQSQEDRATVPIYYEPRLAKLHLSAADIDKALAEIVADLGVEGTDLERRKSQWAALARAAGAKERVDEVAADILRHFKDRSVLDGKAMIVCMTRENCVRMYDALRALPGCPEVKVVMTGNVAEDPVAWNEAGHITTKPQRDAIKARMVDPDDPLKLVIVCDMWLVGTDIPCLHTLYVDKPMRGHGIIQAISRVNRVFRDKPHGLVVDYIGIGDELREATATYAKGKGEGEPAADLAAEAVPLFEKHLADVRELLPKNIDYGGWRSLTRIAYDDRINLVFGTLAEDEELVDHFLDAERRLSQSFTLVRQVEQCQRHEDEVIFFQRVRNQTQKALPGRRPPAEIERAVRDLVDDHVESEGIIDVFAAAGIPRADVSILDDKFLQTFKDRPQANLRLKLLQRLLADAINRHGAKNAAKARSFREMLEATLKKYHNRVIDAAAVVKAMVEIHREMKRDEDRAAELGITGEELAFYDAVAAQHPQLFDVAVLRDIVHDVVQAVKRNLKVDWTADHRDDVKAAVRAAVKQVLRRRDVREEDLDPFVATVMAQAELLFRDWPLAA